MKTILNVDAADWNREKWRGPARSYLKWCEKVATIVPHHIIADSIVIQNRYLQEYGKQTELISYGGCLEPSDQSDVLSQWKLESKKYILFVGRLVPENKAHLLVEAFQNMNCGLKLVIVGDAPYSKEYKNHLRQLAGPDTIFTGYQFGEAYRQLSSHALLFVLPARIDGTRPVLLDQMSVGNCVLVSDSAANIDTIGETGISFDGTAEDLVKKIQDAVADPEMIQRLGRLARRRITSEYSWEKVTDQYEQLFRKLLEG